MTDLSRETRLALLARRVAKLRFKLEDRVDLAWSAPDRGALLEQLALAEAILELYSNDSSLGTG